MANASAVLLVKLFFNCINIYCFGGYHANRSQSKVIEVMVFFSEDYQKRSTFLKPDKGSTDSSGP